MAAYRLAEHGVIRTSDDAAIKPGAPEWADYLAFLAGNGVPDPIAPPPAPSLDAQRLEVCAAVNALREAHISGGVTLGGARWDTDTKSRDNLSATTAAIAAGVPLPQGFTWRSADNQDIPMTAAGLVQLAAGFLQFGNACYANSWALKAQVMASSDPHSIDLTTGWPS